MLGQLITWLKADKKWIFFVVASLTAFLIFIFIWLLDQYRTPPSAVPPSYKERVEPLAKELGVTEKALRNFFNITNKKEVPLSDLDNTLREIATHHNALMEKLDSLSPSPTDPVVFALIVQAKQALEKGDFDQAERLFNQASARDLKAATDAQETANQQLVLAAESLAVNGDSKMTQLAYQQAGEYFEHAAELLPAGHDGTLADYLNKAGAAYYYIAAYDQAKPLYERALAIWEQVSGKQHPDVAKSLHNLAELYRANGQYDQAKPLYERAIAIVNQFFEPDHPNVRLYNENYNQLLAEMSNATQNNKETNEHLLQK